MMKTCQHGEPTFVVVFVGAECPVCDVLADILDLKRQLQEAREATDAGIGAQSDA